MAKKWHVSEQLHFEKYAEGVTLNCRPDETISIIEGEIGDMIKALQRIEAHFAALELAETEAARLECWGQKRTPTTEEIPNA